MILREPSETLPGSRSITSENMVRRNGSVRSVQRNMQFSQIGRPIVRYVGLRSINASVEHYFAGIHFVPYTQS